MPNGHRETTPVYLSLVPVVVGIVIASGAEPMFNLVGFLAALTATAGRALKSVLQGLMLSDSSEKMDSLSLLLYMAPVATAALVPITLYFEPTALANALVLGRTGGFWPLLLFNAVMAYFVNLTNFLVTKYTSALTLQVLGNAKGIVAVIASVLVFRNPVTFYTVLGYSVTVGGVILYSHAKRQSKKHEALKKLTAKVSDVESSQPRSPFSTTAESRQGYASGGGTGGDENTGSGIAAGGKHGRTMSSSLSDRIMARGFSSIFEA
jgi:drug/metabolite transporter (DMT)-like permease